MLITVYLHLAKLFDRPTLFLSWYFKKHQKEYYNRLYLYHDGTVEKWLDFFLDGIKDVANEAIATVHKINDLRDADLLKIQSLGKAASESSIKILPELYKFIVNVAKIQQWTKFTRQVAQKVIDRFVKLGILQQKDENKEYGRSFVYKKYLDIFKD